MMRARRVPRPVLALCLALAACSADKGGGAPAKPAAEAKPEAEAAKPAAEAKPEEAAKPAAPEPAAALGLPAPAFALKDLDGGEHTLEQYRGKVVVLEWFNPDCPFVNHAHLEGELKEMAAKASAEGVVWLAINSGAPGKQGHGVEANRAGVEKFGLSHPILLDERGEVGHLYGAVKTPHLFVIDDGGVLVYRGAIDNAPMGEVRDAGAEKVNYVAAALADLKEKRPVATAESPAYGCSVKYGS